MASKKSRLSSPKTNAGKNLAAPMRHGTGSTNSETPHFCLHHLQPGYRVENCDKGDKAAFAEQLDKLSQMTWEQITSAPRKGLGYEKIATNSLKVSSEKITDKYGEDLNFIAFRFSGQKAMVGFRDGTLLRIIWLDHNYSVYDHGS